MNYEKQTADHGLDGFDFVDDIDFDKIQLKKLQMYFLVKITFSSARLYVHDCMGSCQ